MIKSLQSLRHVLSNNVVSSGLETQFYKVHAVALYTLMAIFQGSLCTRKIQIVSFISFHLADKIKIRSGPHFYILPQCYIPGPTYCTAYHRLVTGEQEIFCDELNYQVTWIEKEDCSKNNIRFNTLPFTLSSLSVMKLKWARYIIINTLSCHCTMCDYFLALLEFSLKSNQYFSA